MRTLRCLRLKSERRRTVDCYGLLFLDGHAGFYQPEPEPTGEAASMELAHLERTGAPPGSGSTSTSTSSTTPSSRRRLPPSQRYDMGGADSRPANGVASDRATGLDITIFNPTPDPDGRVGSPAPSSTPWSRISPRKPAGDGPGGRP
jgi:hypothetical protein